MCYLALCASTRPVARAVLRSTKAVTFTTFVAGGFLFAQVVFQTSYAAIGAERVPTKWLEVFGLQKFDEATVGTRSLIPDAFVALTSLWARGELRRELAHLEAGGSRRTTAIAKYLRRGLMFVVGLTEEDLRNTIQKWWRLLGFICCGVVGYSANGVLQFLLFVAVHTRFVGGRGDPRTSRLTRLEHAISTTGKMQFLTGLIIFGSYVFTSLGATSQELETSKVANIFGFWTLGRNGRLCCMKPAQTVGFIFALLANACFALAVSHGDIDSSFKFQELMGFRVRVGGYRPLLYAPILAAAIMFTGLATVGGLPMSMIQVVDIVTVLVTILRMLASARNLSGTRGADVDAKKFQDKWLVRLRNTLWYYIAFQYVYISLLYVYNIPEVAGSLMDAWPSSLSRQLTPLDFGLLQTPALLSWKYMWPRYLTLVMCVMLYYWLNERLQRDSEDYDSDWYEDGLPEGTPIRRLDMSKESESTKVEDINTMRPSIFLYHATATVLKHVKDSVGDEFESALHGVSMELLLLVATICVAFRVEVVSVLYVVVIMFACIEFAVPTIRGKAPVPLRYGTFSVIGTSMRILTDSWRFLNRMRRIRSNVITAADITPPPIQTRRSPSGSSGWFRRHLRESDYHHAAPVSIHTEVNDYGFYLALLATISIVFKQLTLLTIFQSGSLNTLVNENWGSWLGLISLYDPRLGDDLQTTTSCCAWPYVLDSTKTFCQDASVAASSSNQFPTQACLTFTTNWYIFGAHYAVIIFAVLHGFLQRRHNVKVQRKAKSTTATAVPRASYWAKLRGEVQGCDVAKKLKLLIVAERMKNKNIETPVGKKKIVTTDEGMSPMVQQTPIRAEEDIFANLVKQVNAGSLKHSKSKIALYGWRPIVIRMVYRFVKWDVKNTFETLDSAIEQLASLKYLLAMAVLLINAFLKSDVTSSIYIIILGYFLAFNNRAGVVRFQSQGYAILLIIGAILAIHIMAALRLPPSLLNTNYCETCPEKRFWLDIWDCPSSAAAAPAPSSLSAYLDCNSRPVFVHEYEIISDILVMLLVGHYVRKGHKNMVRDDVRTAWMRGYVKAKGQKMGSEWVQSEAFTSLANKVNTRLAERRKLDETSELSYDDKIKRWDAVNVQLQEYVPSVDADLQREEMKRANWTNRNLSRQVSIKEELQVIQEHYTFSQIASMAIHERRTTVRRRNEEIMGQFFLKFFYKYLLLVIVILTTTAAVAQHDSDFISLCYAGITILFSMRFNELRINTRIFPSRAHKWWNGELFRLLPVYVFTVLAAKLVYQIPYIKPILLNGRTARLGSCVVGTRMCETINSLFGVRKLGSACDATMLAADCVSVLGYSSGSIGVDVALFILCSVQAQLFSNERYVREVLRLEKNAMDKRARRSILYRKYILGWRAKIQQEIDEEYKMITDKVRASALQASEWTHFQKFRHTIDEETAAEKYVPEHVTVRAQNSTTVEVKWKMRGSTDDIEQFTIKRERSPRTTIFPHHVNPVKVDVDAESRAPSSHVISGLTPGMSYSFTVQSCSRSIGYGPPSEPSDVVTMPMPQDDEEGEEVLSGKDKLINGVAKVVHAATNSAAYLLDPALYPLPNDKGGESEWTRKGDWGGANIITGFGKIIYSQSERLLYIALVCNFIDHVDLMSACLVIFILAFAAMWNPQPLPEMWRFIFWYSVACFYARILLRSKAFCMELDANAKFDNRNKWYISAQPYCPTMTLYDPAADSEFSTLSATLLTVPRARNLVRDEVWTDIFLIVTLVLHMSHMHSLGQCARRDAIPLAPREDYQTYHAGEFKDDIDLAALTSPPLEDVATGKTRQVETHHLEGRTSKERTRASRRRERRRAYMRTFGLFTRGIHVAQTRFRELVTQICLSNSAKMPKRNVGKPGVDLYSLEIFLQLIITCWFVTGYRNLVFESGTALSSTESFGTGLTISIVSSVMWIIVMRLVYLSQNIKLKFYLHFAQVVLYVSLVFIFLPLLDTRSFVSPRHNSHLKAFTVLMLFQFIVSALQLREGFREGYQFKIVLMRFGNTPVGRFVYNLINTLPFLFEIRTLLDWVVCDTSIDYVMWFRYETLYYLLHKTDMLISWRRNRRQYYSGAKPVPWPLKILLGGGIIAIIMLLLTGPIFIFSTFNPALTSNRIEAATMQVQLDFYADEKTERHRIYSGFATGYGMSSISQEAMKSELLRGLSFRSIDSDCVRFPKYSQSAWILPQSSKLALAQSLNTAAAASTCTAKMTITTEFTRLGPLKAKTVSQDLVATLTNAHCAALAGVITNGQGSIQFANVIPRGFHLTPETMVEILDFNTSAYIGLNMTLGSTPTANLWEVTPTSPSFPTAAPDFCGIDSTLPPSDYGVLYATISDRYLVGLVSSLGLSSYSLRALYGFVFVTVGFFVRTMYNFKLSDVFVNEIANTDELINVCRGLRLIRSLDYPGRRRDEMKMYYSLMRMMRESSLRRVISRNADEI